MEQSRFRADESGESMKRLKEIAVTTTIGLRTVQSINKMWEDSVETSSSRTECGRKKSAIT